MQPKFLCLILLLLLIPVTNAQFNIEAQNIEPNAKVFLDRTSYGPGSIMLVGIFNRNFNLHDDVVESMDLTQIAEGDPIVEVRIVQPTQGTLTLSAVDGSMKDSNGNSMREAIESGPNTSLFEFEVKLPDGIEANSSITVLYNDPFELSPTSREEIPVQEKVTLTDTRFTDQKGNLLKEVTVMQQVIISSTIRSSLSSKQEYAYIVLVKDSDGFTDALSWISGSIEPNRSASAVVAWTPKQAGQYAIEIFVWQSLFKPVPLLKEVKTTIIVN